VHNGTICLDGTSDGIIVVLEVDDYNFGGGGFVFLFANADEGVRFEGLDKSVPLLNSFNLSKTYT
jgi:hypothetical protein